MEGREPELFNAASTGDETRVQELLAEGVNPNATDSNWTPLHQAALNGHTGTVLVLSTAGANPNATNRQGETPLHEAAWNGHTETVQALLAAGSDPDAQDKLGDTALHDASRLGRHMCVAALLKAGANASVRNDDNQIAEEVAGRDYSVSPAQREAVLRTFQDHKTSTDSASVPVEVELGGPELRALYDRACEEGYTEVYRTRFVLTGKFGTGKTNLCSSLVGDDFDPEWKITDGIAIHPCVMTQEQQWRELGGQEDQLPQAVADIMKKLKDEEQPKSPSTYSKVQTNPDVLDTTHGEMTSQEKRASETAPPEPKRQRVTVSEEQTAEKLPEAYLKAAKIFGTKDDHSGSSATGTRENPQISIWDFGGQEIFYSTQQVCYTHRAIYGMTLDLTKPLDSPVEKTAGGPTSHCHTEKDFIDYHLESIRVHTRPKPLRSTVGQTPEIRDIEPPVLFIFTHKDQVTKDVEQRFQNDTRAHLKGKIIDKHIVDRYFSVDNTKRNPEDPEVAELRKFIVDLAKQQSYMGERIPIKWLELKSKLQDMHKEGKRYCSLEDVMEAMGKPPVGTTLEENAISILTFWHLCGDIIYFPVQNLRNFVILDPQWFVDVCKTIITIPQYRDREVKEEWDRLQETGELQDHLIGYVWKHREEALQYNLINHKQELLDMMEKFDLVLHCHGHGDEESGPKYLVAGEATYFVPSLLATASNWKKLYPPGAPCSKPIFIVFDGKFCPVGLYHRMVISSMRRYFKVKPQQAYASCAKFITSNPRQTFIITKEKFYLKVELVSSVQDEANRFSHGSSVREGLEEDLREIIDKWAPGIRYKWCLRCSCEDHGKEADVDRFIPITEINATEYFKNGEVVCETYAPATTTVQDIGLADWFENSLLQEENGRNSTQTPKEDSEESSAQSMGLRLEKCFHLVVQEVCPKWRELGYHLNLPPANVEEIELRHRGDPRSCCRAVCDRWVQLNGSSATVEVLKDALISIGQVPTVEHIDALLQQTSDPRVRGRSTRQQTGQEHGGVDCCFPVIVDNVCPRWTELSRHLGLTKPQVDEIATKHQDDPRECCWEVLKLWSQLNGERATKARLRAALESAEEMATAEKLTLH